MRKKRVVVLMGGPGSERAVSLASGKNILRALKSVDNLMRYIALFVDVRDPKKVLAQLDKVKPDVIYPTVHGTFGEEGTLQALLDTYGKPYVGSGLRASALCMDKILSSALLEKHGLTVPKVLMEKKLNKPSLTHGSQGKFAMMAHPISFPCVVKPRASGSSVGISIVHKQSELAKALSLASKESEPMIQEYIKGVEVSCGVLQFEKEPFALPVTEMILTEEFHNYRSKYVKGASQELTPARISPALTKQVQEAALLAHQVLGCRHISRSDFIIVKNKIYYLETNTAPGMTDTSLVPQAAQVAGIDLPKLVHKLIQSCL